MTTKLEKAKPRIISAMEDSKGVFTLRELQQLIHSSRVAWDLAHSTKVTEVLDLLQADGRLRKLTLRAQYYSPFVRYIWGEVSAYRLAASIWKRGYLTHGSAVFLHGLTNEIPKTVYLNKEQSAKPVSRGGLTQERIDMAFSRAQRTSSYVLTVGEYQVVLLSGKQTGRLEVGELPDPEGKGTVPATLLERTLIDIAVRPNYAGGVPHVLDAFRGALDRVRVPLLVATLKRLDYVYPYHQSVGFLLERAGLEAKRLEALRTIGIEFDFHLAHGMREKDYDSRWRLFFPKGL